MRLRKKAIICALAISITIIVIAAVTASYSVTLPNDAAWIYEYAYAHRGYHDKDNPENSIAAIRSAVEKSYGIELDVRLSRDSVPVVFHDATLRRMAGRPGKVSDYTAEELSRLRLKNTEYGIPTLREALDEIDGKAPVIIEIKRQDNSYKLEESVWNVLKDYKGKYAVQSFSPYTLKWFANNAPDTIRCLLTSDDKSLIPTIIISRPHAVSVDKKLVKRPTAQILRAIGKPALAWTIKNQREYDKLKDYCDQIIFENFEPKS